MSANHFNLEEELAAIKAQVAQLQQQLLTILARANEAPLKVDHEGEVVKATEAIQAKKKTVPLAKKKTRSHK